MAMEGQRDVVELDSSTPAKWSRHLVVRLPGAAWADNRHAARFLNPLLDRPEVRPGGHPGGCPGEHPRSARLGSSRGVDRHFGSASAGMSGRT